MLRRELGLSQGAIGTRGFVSTPGWIKIENGQRQASEKLLARLVQWLVDDKHLRKSLADPLREELLTLKYLGSRSAFVRGLARVHAKELAGGSALLAEDPPEYRIKRRGRPPGSSSKPRRAA